MEDGKRQRFFIEAGAFDGARISNSLFLEMKHNWTGILVEPDPNAFQMMKGNQNWVAFANRSILTSQQINYYYSWHLNLLVFFLLTIWLHFCVFRSEPKCLAASQLLLYNSQTRDCWLWFGWSLCRKNFKRRTSSSPWSRGKDRQAKSQRLKKKRTKWSKMKNIFKINKNKNENEIRLTKLIFRIDMCYIM